MNRQFKYRMLTGWINDISSRPRFGKAWPILDADAGLVDDYKSFLFRASELGFNGMIIWGLFTSRGWPVDLETTLDPERRNLLSSIIRAAHERGIRVLSGLGVYSWGFEEIIREFPAVKSGNRHLAYGRYFDENDCVMCLHQPEARKWMRKVVDYSLSALEIDGFQLQPADQGRCVCGRCAEMGNTEYYATLCRETAEYIREKNPDLTVAVSGWGMDFDSTESFPILKRLSSTVDYITDISETAMIPGAGFRKSLIAGLDCPFGTGGGLVVVPPQRWDRFRWFLPHVTRNAGNLKSLARDGGRSFEFFAGPLVNPGTEITFEAMGNLITDPGMETKTAVMNAVRKIFQPADDASAARLAELVFKAEEIYFEKTVEESGGRKISGEFDFEPLIGGFPGPAVYLDRLAFDRLNDYRSGLEELKEAFVGLGGKVRNRGRITDVCRSIDGASADIDLAVASRG